MAASSAITARGRSESRRLTHRAEVQLALDIGAQPSPTGGNKRSEYSTRGAEQESGAEGYSQAMLNVIEFHRSFNLPRAARPRLVDAELAQLRIALLHEEVSEFADAIATHDLIGIADALADILYVAYGTAVTYGLDLDAVVAEIHRSNMSKLDAGGRPIHRADGKVLKSDQYSPPDILAVLSSQAELPI